MGFLAVGLLPFGFSALHFFFGDCEDLADGIVEAFGFGPARDCWRWSDIHGNSVTLRLDDCPYGTEIHSVTLREIRLRDIYTGVYHFDT